MVRVLCLLALAACEARLGGDIVAATLPDAAAGPDLDAEALEPDAAPDAAPPLGPWSAPTPVAITPATDDDPSATGDLLELYFNRANDIFVTKRATVNDAWGPPAVVPELSVATAVETTPEVTYDGLIIFLSSNRAPLTGVLDLWVAKRASRAAAWGAPQKVTELSTASREAASACGNGLQIVFESDRNGTNDTFFAERPNTGVAFGTAIPVGAVNTGTSSDGNPMLSANQLELYINSDRSGNDELYVATRASTADAFGPPVLISELANPGADSDPWISPDGRTMYFTSDRDGVVRLWQTTR